jgi:hypothetical protein
MADQLRIYTIADGRMEDWAALFRRTTMPMRRSAGFDVRTWASTDGTKFFWLLSRSGSEEEFLEADRAYNEAPEHAAVLAVTAPSVADDPYAPPRASLQVRLRQPPARGRPGQIRPDSQVPGRHS